MMAILRSNALRLEIRYARYDILPGEFEPEKFVQLEVDLRYDGHILINPVLLNPREQYFGKRGEGVFHVAVPRSSAETIMQAFQSALESSQPSRWQAIWGNVSFYIYPGMYFPPLRPSDFNSDRPQFFLAEEGEAPGEQPEDIFTLYIELADSHPYKASQVLFGTTFDVYRHELQSFVDDLKYEWGEFQKRNPDETLSEAQHMPMALVLEPMAVEVYLYQPQDSYGWIDLHLTINGAKWEILASSSFPPFDDVLNFFIDLAENRLPCSFTIDEEGREKMVHARPWDTPDLCHFELIDLGYPRYELLMTNIVYRRQFVLAFYHELTEFMDTHFDPEKWNSHGPLFTPGLLDALKAAITRMG